MSELIAFVAAALAVILLAPVVRAPSKAGWGEYRASAQSRSVSICGGCYCYDGAEREQCFAKQQADFERANPPRGQIEGVCYASYYKHEREPGTNKQIMRTRNAIYTRIRYEETKPVGFNEVGAAWSEFVNSNYGTEFPRNDGWNWSQTCVALNKPKSPREVEGWEQAQGQHDYKRVFMPTFGVADTPEERALEAKFAAERQARLAEQQREAERQRRQEQIKAVAQSRQRAEADYERRAEAARKEAEKQARVDAIAAQIGPGKRAEAERLQRMNDELAALRPKAQKPRQCTSRSFSQAIVETWGTQEVAMRAVRARVGQKNCNMTGSESVKSMSAGTPACTQRKAIQIIPPPVGKCLSCISEHMAMTVYGYVPGKGYPPPITEWTCRATAQCTVEKCDSSPSRVSAQ